jgi:hypothetical protein
MPSYDFRCVHLPYCIKKLPSGKHIVLNRDYKPIGFRTAAQLDYEAYPIGIEFKRLTAKTVSKLSCKSSSDASTIYLYDERSIPTKSARNMQAYLERLGILAKLQFIEDRRGRPRLPGEIVSPESEAPSLKP